MLKHFFGVIHSFTQHLRNTIYIPGPILQVYRNTPHGAYLHSSKGRQAYTFYLYTCVCIYIYTYVHTHTYYIIVLQILLGSSRRKLKQGTEKESYTAVLFFYRENQKSTSSKVILKQSPERNEGVNHGDT